MKIVGQLNHKKFSTIIKISQEVENFLRNNNIDLNLGSRFPSPEYFYENILFQREENREHNNFELVYLKSVQSSDDAKEVEDIIDDLEFEGEIILDGHLTILDIEPKTLIKWIVIRK